MEKLDFITVETVIATRFSWFVFYFCSHMSERKEKIRAVKSRKHIQSSSIYIMFCGIANL